MHLQVEGELSNYNDLNNRHPGHTIFIIGGGPQLAALTKKQMKKLENSITIGLNKTTYRLKTTYFLSAYISQVLLSKMCSNKTIHLHMRPKYEPPLVKGIIPLKRTIFSKEEGLNRFFSSPEPILKTKRNAALAATHLAFILGAKRIVYIGIEQKNLLHFYDFDPLIKKQIYSDLEKLKDCNHLGVDHPYENYQYMVDNLSISKDSLEKQPFYRESHEESFQDYFSILNQNSVDVFATTKNSVVFDAGAQYADLDFLLNQNGLDSFKNRLSGIKSRLSGCFQSAKKHIRKDYT